MSDPSNALCYPACHTCRVAGICERESEAIERAHRAARKPRAVWSPNQLDEETLPCGHDEIPWPIVQLFGSDIESIWCGTCGHWINRKKGQSARKGRGKAKVISDDEPIPF